MAVQFLAGVPVEGIPNMWWLTNNPDIANFDTGAAHCCRRTRSNGSPLRHMTVYQHQLVSAPKTSKACFQLPVTSANAQMHSSMAATKLQLSCHCCPGFNCLQLPCTAPHAPHAQPILRGPVRGRLSVAGARCVPAGLPPQPAAHHSGPERCHPALPRRAR